MKQSPYCHNTVGNVGTNLRNEKDHNTQVYQNKDMSHKTINSSSKY